MSCLDSTSLTTVQCVQSIFGRLILQHLDAWIVEMLCGTAHIRKINGDLFGVGRLAASTPLEWLHPIPT